MKMFGSNVRLSFSKASFYSYSDGLDSWNLARVSVFTIFGIVADRIVRSHNLMCDFEGDAASHDLAQAIRGLDFADDTCNAWSGAFYSGEKIH